MIATIVTLALLGLIVAILIGTLRNDGAKILAALAGRSRLAEPPLTVRPVQVRFSQRYRVSQPLRAQPAWRAAA